MDLIKTLVKEGWLETPEIIEAFKKVKRADFMPGELKEMAGVDEPFPIGHKQTISQPMVVAFMLEQLQPKEGQKILDIGSGSGWTSNLLSHIVGKNGRVVAMEIIPELCEGAEENSSKYSFVKDGTLEFVCGDGRKGREVESPFDNILASAAGKEIPEAWKKQLRTGGRIVAPMGNSIWVFKKIRNDHFEEKEYPGYSFVPLV